MPRDGLQIDYQNWDPDKKEVVVDGPTMPSPFAPYLNNEQEGVVVTDVDCPNVSGEQRRLLLQGMIPKVLGHIGVQVEVVEPVRYVIIPETREEFSRVSFGIRLKQGNAIERFKFNVPPYGDWHREVMVVILDYLWAWGHKVKCRS